MIVYKATNKVNGKVYVGITIQPLATRIRGHLKIERLRHPFPYALRKYGRENFTIEPIAWCYTKEHLNFLEKFYIEFFNCKAPNGYNLTDGGNGSGGYSWTETQREQRRRDYTGEDNPFYGKKHTEDAKQGMSEKQKTRFSNKENHPNYGKKFPYVSDRNKRVRYCGERNGWYGKGYLHAGELNPRYGVKLSDEEKKKVSERTKEAMSRPEVKEKHRLAMQRIKESKLHRKGERQLETSA